MLEQVRRATAAVNAYDLLAYTIVMSMPSTCPQNVSMDIDEIDMCFPRGGRTECHSFPRHEFPAQKLIETVLGDAIALALSSGSARPSDYSSWLCLEFSTSIFVVEPRRRMLRNNSLS